jgi:hypothetical protein
MIHSLEQESDKPAGTLERKTNYDDGCYSHSSGSDRWAEFLSELARPLHHWRYIAILSRKSPSKRE